MKHTFKFLLKHYLFYLGGDQPSITWAEPLHACIGALFGLLLVLTNAKVLGDFAGIGEWLMTSLGLRLISICSSAKSYGATLGSYYWKYLVCSCRNQLLSPY